MGQTADAVLDQKIEILETLQKLDELLSQAQTGAKIAGAKPETGDAFTDYQIEQIVDLTKQLSETVNEALEPASAAKTGIDVAQALVRLHEAALAAKTSTGAEKADQFAKLVSSWGGAAEALPWLIRGMSFNPMFTIYFFYLTKSLEALAVSIGVIEEYYATATGIWPDVLEPAYLDKLADAAATRQQREDARAAMEHELWQLKTQRWINQRVAHRRNAGAALEHCLRNLSDKYGADFPSTPEGLETYVAAVNQLESDAIAAFQLAQQLGDPEAAAAAARDAGAKGDEVREHRRRLAELYDCIDKTLRYTHRRAVPVAAPEERPGILATSWKYVAGGAVALLAVIGGYLGLQSDGDPVATPSAPASTPSTSDSASQDQVTPSSSPVAAALDPHERFRGALPDGFDFAGQFGTEPCDVYDLTGRVEVAGNGVATMTQTAGGADFQANRGGVLAVSDRYVVVWAAAAADASYGEAWLVVVDMAAVENGSALGDAVRVLNVNGDTDSMVANSEVGAAVGEFVGNLDEAGVTALTPEQFAQAMQATPSACSGELRDQTVASR